QPIIIENWQSPPTGRRRRVFAKHSLPSAAVKPGRGIKNRSESRSKMNLKSLLLSSDEKTVRVLRRVLSDLEIDVEHCSAVDDAIHRITRQRFEAIIVDGANAEEAGSVL